jgi:hypothetical protein
VTIAAVSFVREEKGKHNQYTRCARPAAPDMGGYFWNRNPGRRSRTRFALGYHLSPFQGFESRLDPSSLTLRRAGGILPHRDHQCRGVGRDMIVVLKIFVMVMIAVWGFVAEIEKGGEGSKEFIFGFDDQSVVLDRGAHRSIGDANDELAQQPVIRFRGNGCIRRERMRAMTSGREFLNFLGHRAMFGGCAVEIAAFSGCESNAEHTRTKS